MSKTILVPTDFSKGAGNALEYAVALAKKENAKIILLNVYHLTVYISELTGKSDRQIVEEMESSVNKNLQSLCRNISKTKKVKCEYISKYDLAVDGILDTIREIKPDMVIMGTKGASGVKEILMGSNTAKVIEKAKCPVIAVPENASFKGIRLITFATDYHASDIDVIKKLAEIAKPFNAKINVLHASEEDLTHEAEEMGIERFKNLVSKKIKYNKISFRVLYGRYLENVLQNHIKEESPDLLAMSTREKNFIERLFGTSTTKRMAYHTNVPLLAFHHKQESVVFI